ncbi:MAG: Ig-like domain-containing protein [Myxococcales bacterium]|nr:Ig-like domain-containing protein [Myxococcales bacterium]
MKGHRTALAALPAILVALGSAPAGASGIATHMFHAEIGAANVEDPDLRAILAANREAWISAASFPDGGYPVDYVWAEPAHWAPFANAYTEQVKSVCQGRYTTDAYCEKLVAHLMGAVGHGFEDQVVDALLGPKILEVDGDDSNADFYIDLFVLHDFDRDAFVPRRWFVPIYDLLAAFDRMPLAGVDRQQLWVGATLIAWGNVGERIIEPLLIDSTSAELPFAYANYYDYPGGVTYIGEATAHLFDYYWSRLNDTAAPRPDVFRPFPPDGAVDVATNRPETDTQIGLVLDRPFVPASVNSTTFHVTDPTNHQVLGVFHHRTSPTSEEPTSHMLRFSPRETLLPNTLYTVTVDEDATDELGASLVPGGYSWTFTTGGPAPTGDLVGPSEVFKHYARGTGAMRATHGSVFRGIGLGVE